MEYRIKALYEEYLKEKLDKIIKTKDLSDTPSSFGYGVRPEFSTIKMVEYLDSEDKCDTEDYFFNGKARHPLIWYTNGWNSSCKVYTYGAPKFYGKLVKTKQGHNSYTYMDVFRNNGNFYSYGSRFINGLAIAKNEDYISNKTFIISKNFSSEESNREFIKETSDGYIKIEKQHTPYYNLYDSNWKLVFDSFHRYIGDEHSFPWVVYDAPLEKYFIDKDGKKSSEFGSVKEFREGLAPVCPNTFGDWHYINEDFEYAFNRSFSDAWPYNDGRARIAEYVNGEYLYNFIDLEGKNIRDTYYVKANDYHEGFAAVEQCIDGLFQWNFIDTDGDVLCDTWYDFVKDFHNGFAVVQRNGLYNVINRSGHEISHKWFDNIADFENGLALVTDNRKYNFINEDGQLVSDIWFKDTYPFRDGMAIVIEPDGSYGFISQKGERLRDKNNRTKFYSVTDFFEGYAAVEISRGKWNLIDKEGNYLYKRSIKCSRLFPIKDGLACYEKESKSGAPEYGYVDEKGKKVTESMKYPNTYDMVNFVSINYYLYPKKIDLGNYKVSKKRYGYKLQLDKKVYKMKHRPFKAFGDRYILCLSKDKLIAPIDDILLYDTEKDKYEAFEKNLIYDDNFIYTPTSIMFMHDNNMYDVTKYFRDSDILDSKGIVEVLKTEDKIYTIEEFEKMEDTRIEQIINEEKKKKEVEKQLNNIQEKEELLKQKEFELREAEKRRKLEIVRIKKQILELLKRLKELSVDSKIDRIVLDDYENIFVEVDDHVEINDIFVPFLSCMDLQQYPFTNVKMDGIDFSNTNLEFDPQKVFGKSLKDCNFEGVYISPWMRFDGVDIRGCKFSEDNDPTTADFFNSTFSQAIYDDNTTYNGVSLKVMLARESEKIRNKKRNR